MDIFSIPIIIIGRKSFNNPPIEDSKVSQTFLNNSSVVTYFGTFRVRVSFLTVSNSFPRPLPTEIPLWQGVFLN